MSTNHDHDRDRDLESLSEKLLIIVLCALLIFVVAGLEGFMAGLATLGFAILFWYLLTWIYNGLLSVMVALMKRWFK